MGRPVNTQPVSQEFTIAFVEFNPPVRGRKFEAKIPTKNVSAKGKVLKIESINDHYIVPRKGGEWARYTREPEWSKIGSTIKEASKTSNFKDRLARKIKARKIKARKNIAER